MKKPVNRVALFLWFVAIISVFLNSIELWSAFQNMTALRQESGEAYLSWASTAHSISAVLVQFGFLFGIGMLIEIADQILWHIRNSNQNPTLS